MYLYVTGDCNQRCAHCWIEAAHVTAPRGGPPVTPAEVRRAVEEARPLGLESVKVTGGEPFVRPDAIDIIEAVAAAGVGVSVETNGTLIDGALAARLAASVGLVSVSLDGATAATHDALRGQPGAFARTLRSIAGLVRGGVAVQVITTLSRASAAEVDGVLDLCARLGVASFKLNLLAPMGRGRALHAAGAALSIAEVIAITHHVEEERAPELPFAVDSSLPLAFVSRARLRAGAGHRCPIVRILGVLGDGRLSVCGAGYVVPELLLGHLRSDSLARVWRESPTLGRLRAAVPARLEGVCGRCVMRDACLGACRVNAVSLDGSLLAPEWFCRAAERAGLFPRTRLVR
jgi:SynChlorMet cassette radical SAM/SPASM protein ScmF